MGHGNLSENPNPHHLYVIYDKEEATIFKYGISDDSVDEDGLSKRLRDQLAQFNRIVNKERFIGKVLILNIPGRKRARLIERQFIQNFKDQHGRRPRGNLQD